MEKRIIPIKLFKRILINLADFLLFGVIASLVFLASQAILENTKGCKNAIDWLENTQLRSGILAYDDKNELTYKEYATPQEYIDSFDYFYKNFLDEDSYYVNVFVLGLDDVDNKYTANQLSERYKYVTDNGKKFFEYAENTSSLANAIPYTNLAPTFDYLKIIQKEVLHPLLTSDDGFILYVQKYNLYTLEIPIIIGAFIGYGLLYVLVPLLNKKGATVFMLLLKGGLVAKNDYEVFKAQILFRQLGIFIIEVACFFLWPKIVFYVVNVLYLLGGYIYLIFNKEHISLLDFLSGTKMLDTNLSLYFVNSEQEKSYSEEETTIEINDK
jgi:hypothetical protein